MRLLITGGCGFIGHNVIKYARSSHRIDMVINVDRLDSNSHNSAYFTQSTDTYHFEHLDLAHDIAQTKLVELMTRFNVTHVLHLAALSHVDDSFTSPAKYIQANIIGTFNLIEACRAIKLVQFIYTSTDEIYGDPINYAGENAPLYPSNPYAATKAAGDMLVQSYAHSFGLPAMIIRPNNIFGPGQDTTKVIPKFIQLAQAGTPLTISGDGSQTRNFLHVDDFIDALFILLLDRYTWCGTCPIYNINSTDEISIIDLATLIWSIIHPSPPQITFITDRPYNDKHYHITAEPIRALGWVQKCNMTDKLIELIGRPALPEPPA